MEGLSGRRYRAFINNLIGALPGPRYLEIGTWARSTLCSAIFGNKVEAVAIDNWSLFGRPFGRFFANLAAFKGSANVSFLERDFRQINYAQPWRRLRRLQRVSARRPARIPGPL